MIKESLIVLVLVGLVGVCGLDPLGGAMSRAIDGPASSDASSVVFAQAGTWKTVEALARFASEASDEALFGEWVSAVARTRNEAAESIRSSRFSLRSSFERPASVYAVEELARANAFDAAIAMTDRIAAEHTRADAWRRVARELGKAGRNDEAAKLFEQAIAHYEQRNHNLVDDLRNTGRLQGQAGHVEGARATFSRALEIARKYAEPQRSEDERAIAFTQALIGLLDDAEQTANSVAVAEHRAVAQLDVALALVGDGRTDEARNMFDRAVSSAAYPSDRFQIDAARKWAPQTELAQYLGPEGLSAEGVRQVLERGDARLRIAEVMQRSGWKTWLPADDARLQEWGAALASEWASFESLDDHAFSFLSAGAVGVASVVLDAPLVSAFTETIAHRLPLWSRDALRTHQPLLDALSETSLPFHYAIRGLKAMDTPEPRPLVRGIVIQKGLGNSLAQQLVGALRSEEGVVRLRTVGVSASAGDTRKALEREFAAFDGAGVLRISGFEKLGGVDAATEGIETLAHLMDNHPRVMVLGESADPANIHPILRERGRFGPFFQAKAP